MPRRMRARPSPEMVAARELYVVTGVDRSLTSLGKAARWAGAVVQGMLGDIDAPALSDVVITSVDGIELHRIQPATLMDFEDRMREALSDLADLDSEAFAAIWLQEPDA